MTLSSGDANDCVQDSAPPDMSTHLHRPRRVSMISPKLRKREERKRILQLCAHKLKRIKESERNLRRSVCINNTYCRLTDELRREKQARFITYTKSRIESEETFDNFINNNSNMPTTGDNHAIEIQQSMQYENVGHNKVHSFNSHSSCSTATLTTTTHQNNFSLASSRKRSASSRILDTDLEKLDRELGTINAPMLLIDPEITQGAAQLEAISLHKRSRCEDESDRLVREALSQFYMPQQRLISAIEDPLTAMSAGIEESPMGNLIVRRPSLNTNELDMDFDMNQNQKEFEAIMDSLGLGTPSTSPKVVSDTCGQAAMLSESASPFHNLVATSLET